MSQVMVVLNQLYADKKLTLEFNSVEDRENFRTSLYKAKKAQDSYLTALEIEEARKVLKCTLSKIEDPASQKPQMSVWLEVQKSSTFRILLVEEMNPQVETTKDDDGRSG